MSQCNLYNQVLVLVYSSWKINDSDWRYQWSNGLPAWANGKSCLGIQDEWTGMGFWCLHWIAVPPSSSIAKYITFYIKKDCLGTQLSWLHPRTKEMPGLVWGLFWFMDLAEISSHLAASFRLVSLTFADLMRFYSGIIPGYVSALCCWVESPVSLVTLIALCSLSGHIAAHAILLWSHKSSLHGVIHPRWSAKWTMGHSGIVCFYSFSCGWALPSWKLFVKVLYQIPLHWRIPWLGL